MRKRLASHFPVFGLCVGLLFGASAFAQDRIFKSGFEVNSLLTLTNQFPDENAKIASGQHSTFGAEFVRPSPGQAEATVMRLDGRALIDCNLSEDPNEGRVSCPTEGVSNGLHTLEVSYGKNTVSWQFEAVDRPVFSELSPTPGSELSLGAAVTISARITDPRIAIDPKSIKMDFDFEPVGDALIVTKIGTNDFRLTFTPTSPLSPLGHSAEFIATTIDGIVASEGFSFEIMAPKLYTTEIISPDNNAVVQESTQQLKMKVLTSTSFVKSVKVDGEYAKYTGLNSDFDHYEFAKTLLPGSNTINVRVEFVDGTIRELTRVLTYDAAPVVAITSPADFAIFGAIATPNAPGGARNLTGNVESPVTVTGTLSRAVTSVLINQQAAILSADRKSFQFANFFLHEGTNLLSVIATDELGRSGFANRTLYVDQTAPLVTVESPVASAVTSNSTVDVRGLAIDAVEAGVGAAELQVTVKNLSNDSSVAAVVSDRYFIAQDLRLEVGGNELEVKATDSLGNFRTKTVTVSRIAVGSKRVVAISGNRQSTSARGALTQSLKVSATDSFGNPLQNFPIRFDIVRGNGSISTSATAPTKPDGINLARNLVINTNAFGTAEVWMKLGTEASPGGNSVRAWNETIAEDAIFTATATRGVPTFANVDGNNAQFVAADSAPVDALSTVVLDADMNRMIDIPVRYQILSGKARFSSESAPNAQVSADGQSLTVNTDKNGVAAARPIAGSALGNVTIISGAETANNILVGQAVFDLIVLERKSGPTQFSGVVMDHTGKPLSGVRLSISRTNLVSTSDKDGKFLFTSQVPPGKIDLFVDGRNVTAPANNEYPALHFETAVIQGQINQLPHPIYLPPVNRSSSQVVGGNQDVTLTIPGYEGFELIVKANSVTFPDGSKVGPLVVTPVHNDRLPMVPPGGSASFGTLGWTIQPTGTRFDPPAQVKIPNPGNMQAGETAQIVQWDHDLATFVPMGRGTVSEDRTQIITDLGSGITKAGWGGCPGPDCPPRPPNCAEGKPSCRGGQCGCNECQKPLAPVPGSCGDFCIADVLKDNQSCQSNECKMCQAGSCIQRFDENASESIQAFDFKTNGIQTRNLTRFSGSLLAVGVFLGDKSDDYPNAQDPLTDDEKAKWELDFSAYCNANGKWRFKLKQATINVKIYLNNASNVPRKMDTGLSEVVGSNNTRCKKLNEIESRLHRSALVKSALPQSAFSCLHGAPPSGGAPPPLKWPRYDDHEGSFGTFAHEKIHQVRFKSAMNDTFAVFLSEIESLEIPIEGDADTAAEAVERLKDSSELERKIDDQIERVNLISINGNSHSNPEEFYKAKMCSFQYNSWLQTLDAKRGTLNNCAVERVLCPTVECRP